MKAISLFFAVFSVLSSGLAVAQTNEPSAILTDQFSNKAWLEDFHQLIAEMDSHYADLDWSVSYRHMNLAKLRSDTEQKILQSRDDQSAERAIELFLNPFGDGHLSVSWHSNGVQSKPMQQIPRPNHYAVVSDFATVPNLA